MRAMISSVRNSSRDEAPFLPQIVSMCAHSMPAVPKRRRRRPPRRRTSPRRWATTAIFASAAAVLGSCSVPPLARAANQDEASSPASASLSSRKKRPGCSSIRSAPFGLGPKALLCKQQQPIAFQRACSLADRYSSLLPSNRNGGAAAGVDQAAHDFLERLRSEEARQHESLQQSGRGRLQLLAPSRFTSLSGSALRSLKVSALMVLATVLVELDWRELFRDLNRASSVLLSIAWLPLLWVSPGRVASAGGGPALETLVVYLLAVLRPSFLVHVWNDVLVPHTIPTLKNMVVREGWSILWKSLFAPVMPQLPRDASGWAAVHVFVLQAVHRGALKLFTSNLQRHLQSSLASVGRKALVFLREIWRMLRP